MIFPHVDLKHLRALEAFAVGYNLIDFEATALYNIREMVKSDAESYSQTPNCHLIYSLDKTKASQLLDLEGIHVILNVTQNCTDLINSAHEDFIFYNKKSAKFLNYNFSDVDLELEQMIITLGKTYEMIRDELQRIKHTATQIYTALMDDPEAFDINTILHKYNFRERKKIIELTENYYDIILPDNGVPSKLKNKTNEVKTTPPKITKSDSSTNPALDFSKEFTIIRERNKHIFQVFINELDEYRQKKVNESNLELRDMFMPNKLYNYLRRHHWSDTIPEEFLLQWKAALTKNGGLSHEEKVDFEVILRGLNIKNTIIDDIIHGGRGDLEQENKNIPQEPQVSLDIIPSVADFSEFKTWMVKRIAYIEKKLNNQ